MKELKWFGIGTHMCVCLLILEAFFFFFFPLVIFVVHFVPLPLCCEWLLQDVVNRGRGKGGAFSLEGRDTRSLARADNAHSLCVFQTGSER